MDYLSYYDLEKYLFNYVQVKFHKDGFLTAFDFFSIIIWKANRAKSKIAKRLLDKHGSKNLDDIVRELSEQLSEAEDPQERLLILMSKEWGFLLPMASAILTVLWPEEFTVYDVRVCEQLKINNKVNINYGYINNLGAEKVWEEYTKYRNAVREAVTEVNSLRDKDRYLWGKSAAEQLKKNIEDCFI